MVALTDGKGLWDTVGGWREIRMERKGVTMVGQVQREEAKEYVRGAIARAASEAMRAMVDVIAQEQLTRQDTELL